MPEFFCSNAECKRLLTDFELGRISKKHTLHSKYRYCVKCRNKAKTIQFIRCQRCRTQFSNFETIFQTVCDNCNVEKHRIYSRKLSKQQREAQLRSVSF